MSAQQGDTTVGRIESRFAELKKEGRKAFVAYITAGDPSLAGTVELVREFDRRGVDIVELGVPFSDPVADGAVNQEAAMRALAQGVTVGDILESVCEIRRSCEIPIIFFAYYNTILSYGLESFVEDAAEAGLDGALVLDLPPEEASDYKRLMDGAGLSTIFLISPVTSDERIEIIAPQATGFIYYVSQMGVTGERAGLADDIERNLAAIRARSDTPVVIGFGISSPEHVAQAASFADGVVVGSAIVRRVGEFGGEKDSAERVGSFVESLTAALRGD